MIDAFIEGARSISQVCHLVILVPVALTILAARSTWIAVAGAVIGIALGGWVFAVGWIDVTDPLLRMSAVAVALAVLVLVGPRLVGRADLVKGGPAVATVVGAVGFVVTQWWRPCVGVELGSILTNASDDPFGQFLPAVAFMLGVSLPLVLLGLTMGALSPSTATTNRLAVLGGAGSVVLCASVLAGKHGEIVVRLFQWSQ